MRLWVRSLRCQKRSLAIADWAKKIKTWPIKQFFGCPGMTRSIMRESGNYFLLFFNSGSKLGLGFDKASESATCRGRALLWSSKFHKNSTHFLQGFANAAASFVFVVKQIRVLVRGTRMSICVPFCSTLNACGQWRSELHFFCVACAGMHFMLTAFVHIIHTSAVEWI